MQEIDKTIRLLFDKFDQKKKHVEGLKKQIQSGWKTNGVFQIPGKLININVATKEEVIEAACWLTVFMDAAPKAEKLLGVDSIAQYGVSSFQNLTHDLKKRLATIDVREQEKQLAELETRLNGVLSPEERRRLEVEALEKLLD